MIKVTRKQKREKQSEINFFAEFTKIRKHFFSNFNKMLASVKDVRHTSYITYEPDILLFTVIMKNIVGISSMNRMTRDFNTDEAINNIAKSLKIDSLDEIPHYDTINSLELTKAIVSLHYFILRYIILINNFILRRVF